MSLAPPGGCIGDQQDTRPSMARLQSWLRVSWNPVATLCPQVGPGGHEVSGAGQGKGGAGLQHTGARAILGHSENLMDTYVEGRRSGHRTWRPLCGSDMNCCRGSCTNRKRGPMMHPYTFSGTGPRNWRATPGPSAPVPAPIPKPMAAAVRSPTPVPKYSPRDTCQDNLQNSRQMTNIWEK